MFLFVFYRYFKPESVLLLVVVVVLPFLLWYQ